MVPLKELLDRSRTRRYVPLHKDCGISPWNLLLERDKKIVELREIPMLVGITELKLFFEKSRYVTSGGRCGSCPWSLLE